MIKRMVLAGLFGALMLGFAFPSTAEAGRRRVVVGPRRVVVYRAPHRAYVYGGVVGYRGRWVGRYGGHGRVVRGRYARGYYGGPRAARFGRVGYRR
jgi:hypothetical protein